MPEKTSLPTPRFRIGDTVFVASVRVSAGCFPCPDCLCSKTWKVITPAGAEFDVDCERCSGFSSRLPSLAYSRLMPHVRKLTVGSVRIDTAASDDERISYMCVETGVGTGNLFYEPRCHAVLEDAEEDADHLARQADERDPERPHRLEAVHLSLLHLRDAAIEKAELEMRELGYKLSGLLDSLQEALTADDALRSATTKDDFFLKDAVVKALRLHGRLEGST